MNVLITGGAGFIGRTLAARLVRAAHRPVLMDSLHPQVHPRFQWGEIPSGAELVVGDVTSPSSWQSLLQLHRPEVVVHLAAETGTGQSLTEASRHGAVNVVGTTQMLDALAAAAVIPAHIVLASSRAVYGEGLWRSASGEVFYAAPRSHARLEAGAWNPEGPGDGPVVFLPHHSSRVEPRPASVYAATKLAQEHILRAWCLAHGVSLSILRFQNIYGPGQSLANAYTGVLTLFSRLAVLGEVIPVFEDGAIVRDFLHVDHACEALERTVTRPPSAVRILDVGSGQPVTLLQVAQWIADEAGAPPPRVTGQYRDGDVRAAWCDPEPARQELGAVAPIELRDGLRSLVEWVGRTVAPSLRQS